MKTYLSFLLTAGLCFGCFATLGDDWKPARKGIPGYAKRHNVPDPKAGRHGGDHGHNGGFHWWHPPHGQMDWRYDDDHGPSGLLRKTGRFLFDRETFGGNGRTCLTCHSEATGTFSLEQAQRRFLKNPQDPLFRAIDSDHGDGVSYDRLLTTGTVRIDVPLAPNVSVVGDPEARHMTVFRGTPTTRNVTTLQEFLMSDGRETALQSQALSAIHQHFQNSIEPDAKQLDAIAFFEMTDPRFFSSPELMRYARGGRPPKLPDGNTRSEKRGRQFFEPNRQCGVCHGGPMLDTSSEFDQLAAPGSKFHAVGAGLLLGPFEQAFDAEGNFVLHNSPNPNQAFEFTLPDGSTAIVIAPDLGRGAVTGNPDDAFLFKTPTLWGVKDTAPYFHDNSARTLEDVMDQYQRFFQFINESFGFELFPLLTEQDQKDIIAFLKLL